VEKKIKVKKKFILVGVEMGWGRNGVHTMGVVPEEAWNTEDLAGTSKPPAMRRGVMTSVLIVE